MNCRGSLLFELLLSLALFLTVLTGILFAYRGFQDQKIAFALRLEASRKAVNELDRAFDLLKEDFYLRDIPSQYDDQNFKGSISIRFENDASRIITSSITYFIRQKSHVVSFFRRITNPELALGKSTCSDSFSEMNVQNFHFQYPGMTPLGTGNIPTAIDIVGNYMFISTDSAKATDTDLFIFDIHDPPRPVLLSGLNTGPGLADIQVVGPVIYLADQSINGQLQVVDATDVRRPSLIKTIKLPGTYSDNTVVGKKILFENGKLYLGTEKSSIAEVHIFNAGDLKNPIWIGSYEMGAGINAFASEHTKDKDLLYVATPLNPEISALDVTDGVHPALAYWFDAPSGSGNGKSLDRVDREVTLGRTIGNKELYLLNSSSSLIEKASVSVGSSLDDIIYRSHFVFAMASNNQDPFQVFKASSSSLVKFGNKKFPVSSRAVALDCGKKNFFVLLSDPNHPLALISPQ